MIQNIGPHVYSNVFNPVPPKGDSIILAYSERCILLRKDNASFNYPVFSQLTGLGLGPQDFIWLFTVDGIDYFSARQTLELAGYEYVPINYLRTAQPRHLAYAGVVGLSLAHWYKLHQFCGECGKPLQHSTEERMVYCDSCHTMIYPTICPAVIVAVRNGEKLLISKYADRNYKRFALLAGFGEIGETIEETVHREVMEEVGIKVKNLEFYKSQPWPFSDSLLFGFFCDIDGDDELHVDHHELSVAQWVQREDLPDNMDDVSLTMEMMALFKAGKR